jgi:hypothetical protein
MAALTVERKTPKLGQDVLPSFACNLPLPVAAATKLFGGGMIAQNILGNIVAASALASLVVVGVSEKTVDNSTGIAGALTTFPRVGTFLMNNSGAGVDQITVANAGQVCYVADDNTVALTSLGGTRPVAGIIWALDNPVAGTFPQYPSGVWVAIIPGLSAVLGLSAPIAQYATLLDAAAGTATAETIIGYVKNPGSISGCLYTPSAAVVFNAANYATASVARLSPLRRTRPPQLASRRFSPRASASSPTRCSFRARSSRTRSPKRARASSSRPVSSPSSEPPLTWTAGAGARHGSGSFA